jgi:hypothetical protein
VAELYVSQAVGGTYGGVSQTTGGFFLAVTFPLSVERALPAGESILRTETETLYTAVDAVLDQPAT